MVMNTVAYIIHLKRSMARRENVTKTRARCPVSTFIHPATDGNALDKSQISNAYTQSIHEPEYPFPLRNGEVGLFLSHRSCWKRILDEGVDAALILEDDTELTASFDASFEIAIDHIVELGLIQFQVRKIRGMTRVVSSSGASDDRRILEPLVVPLRTNAQLVSRTAAEKLLNSSDLFDRPVDTFLQLRNVTGQRVYSMQPSGVVENSSLTGGSTIHNQDRKIGWIAREIKRLTYRREVHRLSRLYWNSVIASTGVD